MRVLRTQPSERLKTAPGEVLDLAFSPDSRAVAAAVAGQGILLWNLDSHAVAPVRLDAGGRYRPGGLRFSTTGRRLEWQLLAGRRTYDRDARDAATEHPGFLATATAWKVGAGGDLIVSNHGLPEHVLTGWRRKDGEWVRQWAVPTRDLFVGQPTLSPGDDRLAMFTRATDSARWWEQPMRLEVRDPGTAAVLAAGTYPYSYAGPLRFRPDGGQVAAINAMTLLAWELPAGGPPRRAQNDSRKHFTALAYHPDGRRLLATSNDETVHVFDAGTLARVGRYTWGLDRLSAVAVSPDGLLAAAGSANGDAVVWDLE